MLNVLVLAKLVSQMTVRIAHAQTAPAKGVLVRN